MHRRPAALRAPARQLSRRAKRIGLVGTRGLPRPAADHADELLTRVRGVVVLDLRELTFMDCTGIHVGVAANNRGRQAGAHLVLVRGPSHVDRLFALVGTGFPKLAIGHRWPSAHERKRSPCLRKPLTTASLARFLAPREHSPAAPPATAARPMIVESLARRLRPWRAVA